MNKEKISQDNAKWRHDNKDKLWVKVKCVCGSDVPHCKKRRHEKSNKHLNFINKSI